MTDSVSVSWVILRENSQRTARVWPSECRIENLKPLCTTGSTQLRWYINHPKWFGYNGGVLFANIASACLKEDVWIKYSLTVSMNVGCKIQSNNNIYIKPNSAGKFRENHSLTPMEKVWATILVAWLHTHLWYNLL